MSKLVKKLARAASVLALVSMVASPSAIKAQTAPTPVEVKALVGGTVIDVLNGKNISDAVVVIEGDRITAVGPRSSVAIPQGAIIIPAEGKWISPGLMNMHVHLGLNLPGASYIYNENPQARILRMTINGRKTLEAGVTTVRLTGEENGSDFVVKKAFDEGSFDGPRIATVGQIIVPTGGHGTLEADGPDGFAKAVRQQIKAGATWIKFSISGGISDTHGSIAAAPMTDDELRVGIEVAHRNGAKVTAHNGAPVAALKAMEYGVDSFEHGYYFTDPVLKMMKQKGTWLIPTMVVSQPGALEFYKRIGSPQWYLERQKVVGAEHLAMLRDAVRIGVPIALGTDQFPFEPNNGTTATVSEAETYVLAGMTPMQALQAATTMPARMLGMEADIGSITAGKYADILILPADPSKDISALRTIDLVMKGGKTVYRRAPKATN
ncbi:amidohydrolase family protein [Sphingobium boeckii]|uniref:Imidazolonepropionase-like amidohydrolase n=1 Tax=Sphingobium boeckii TaxID=1082345 RepID=A0A7W9AJJ1_9SPHN|nr:amidohydrolase family protein [Sphingobium boeckii]MBB5686873.1 imidazolonepropionase-like amidohydrolase [Sphingobium boeckii]